MHVFPARRTVREWSLIVAVVAAVVGMARDARPQAAVADERSKADERRAAIGATAGGVGSAAVAGGGEAGFHGGVHGGERGPQAEPVAVGVGEQEPLVGLDQAR